MDKNNYRFRVICGWQIVFEQVLRKHVVYYYDLYTLLVFNDVNKKSDVENFKL
jgi:hypothetical protein